MAHRPIDVARLAGAPHARGESERPRHRAPHPADQPAPSSGDRTGVAPVSAGAPTAPVPARVTPAGGWLAMLRLVLRRRPV